MLGVHRASLAAPLVLAGLLLSEGASAQEAERTTTRWYGGQNLITLSASYSVLGVGIAADAEWLALVGLAGYALGGPIVHLAHGRPGVAAGSFGLNLGLPLAGGLLGYGIYRLGGECRSERFWCALGAFMIGGTTGALAANVIDVYALAREEVPAPASAAAPASGAAVWPGQKGTGAVPPLVLGFRF